MYTRYQTLHSILLLLACVAFASASLSAQRGVELLTVSSSDFIVPISFNSTTIAANNVFVIHLAVDVSTLNLGVKLSTNPSCSSSIVWNDTVTIEDYFHQVTIASPIADGENLYVCFTPVSASEAVYNLHYLVYYGAYVSTASSTSMAPIMTSEIASSHQQILLQRCGYESSSYIVLSIEDSDIASIPQRSISVLLSKEYLALPSAVSDNESIDWTKTYKYALETFGHDFSSSYGTRRVIKIPIPEGFLNDSDLVFLTFELEAVPVGSAFELHIRNPPPMYHLSTAIHSKYLCMPSNIKISQLEGCPQVLNLRRDDDDYSETRDLFVRFSSNIVSDVRHISFDSTSSANYDTVFDGVTNFDLAGSSVNSGNSSGFYFTSQSNLSVPVATVFVHNQSHSIFYSMNSLDVSVLDYANHSSFISSSVEEVSSSDGYGYEMVIDGGAVAALHTDSNQEFCVDIVVDNQKQSDNWFVAIPFKGNNVAKSPSFFVGSKSSSTVFSSCTQPSVMFSLSAISTQDTSILYSHVRNSYAIPEDRDSEYRSDFGFNVHRYSVVRIENSSLTSGSSSTLLAPIGPTSTTNMTVKQHVSFELPDNLIDYVDNNEAVLEIQTNVILNGSTDTITEIKQYASQLCVDAHSNCRSIGISGETDRILYVHVKNLIDGFRDNNLETTVPGYNWFRSIYLTVLIEDVMSLTDLFDFEFTMNVRTDVSPSKSYKDVSARKDLLPPPPGDMKYEWCGAECSMYSRVTEEACMYEAVRKPKGHQNKANALAITLSVTFGVGIVGGAIWFVLVRKSRKPSLATRKVGILTSRHHVSDEEESGLDDIEVLSDISSTTVESDYPDGSDSSDSELDSESEEYLVPDESDPQTKEAIKILIDALGLLINSDSAEYNGILATIMGYYFSGRLRIDKDAMSPSANLALFKLIIVKRWKWKNKLNPNQIEAQSAELAPLLGIPKSSATRLILDVLRDDKTDLELSDVDGQITDTSKFTPVEVEEYELKPNVLPPLKVIPGKMDIVDVIDLDDPDNQKKLAAMGFSNGKLKKQPFHYVPGRPIIVDLLPPNAKKSDWLVESDSKSALRRYRYKTDPGFKLKIAKRRPLEVKEFSFNRKVRVSSVHKAPWKPKLGQYQSTVPQPFSFMKREEEKKRKNLSKY